MTMINRVQVDGGTPHDAAREAAAAADVGTGATVEGADVAAAASADTDGPMADAAAPSSNGHVAAGEASPLSMVAATKQLSCPRLPCRTLQHSACCVAQQQCASLQSRFHINACFGGIMMDQLF